MVDLRVYLRLSSDRAGLDSPPVRLGTLAHVALELAGARVLQSIEAGGPRKPRDDAFSWSIQHDLLLRDLVAGAQAGDVVRGAGVVISDDARTVARKMAHPGFTGPVLWAAPATCLLDPPDVAPAALTLTQHDAEALGQAGIRAVSLLHWPRAVDPPATPGRVVVAVAAGSEAALPGLLDTLATDLPGRPVLDVIPDVPLTVRGGRSAPRHPWVRSRLARSCDLVCVLGRSASTDLVAAEAAAAGAAVRHVDPASGRHVTPADLRAGGGGLRFAIAELARWLVEASDPAPAHKEH